MPQERFLCSVCSPTINHLCRPNEDKTILTCCKDGMSTKGIDGVQQLPWIDNHATAAVKSELDISGILKKEPSIKDLLDLLSDIEYDWKKIGLALEVQRNVLEGCSNSPEDNGNKLMKVIRSWVDTMPTDVTWEVVIDTVESCIVKHNSTAMKIREFVGKPDVHIKYLRKKDFVRH